MPARPRLVVLAVLLAGVAGVAVWRNAHPAPGPAKAAQQPGEAVTRAFLAIEAREAELDRTLGAPESDAEAFEDALTGFWDELNASAHAWDTFNAHLPQSIAFPAAGVPAPAGFQDLAASLSGRRLDPAAIQAWLAALRGEGWQVRRSRWQMPAHENASRRSRVVFELLAENTASATRAQVRGTARVQWSSTEPPRPESVVVERLAAWAHTGPAPFTAEAELDLPVPPHTPFTDPLLALAAADGTCSLVAVGAGVRYRRDPAGHWVPGAFASLPPERLWAAAVADWDGDGHDDLILAGGDGVRVLRGPEFAGAGTVVWKSPHRLLHPQAVAAGDFDGDGRLDLWVGQYKLPYQGGQFPTPYHDANDGFPSFLLHREAGDGLRDVTESSGLAALRWRRAYSGSFVDLDGDGDLDLVTASDFAGLDVYENDGKGRFRIRTADLGESRKAFGMAHVTGDLDGDGRIEVFMAGMQSAVASRLDALGIDGPTQVDARAWRRAMTVGNRIFTAGPDGLREAGWARDLADAGWAWAITPLDADNDGHLDFHVANGHETRASTRDYERQFWRHDLHVGGPTNDPAVDLYFRNAAGRRAADRASYGGWQHGAFFRTDAPDRHPDVGWLLGTSVFADTRNAVAADFDGDGRMDLAVTTFEEWPARRQRLVVLRNRTEAAGHWVGFRFDACSAVDATVRIATAGGRQQRRGAAGESYRSQSVGALHFGLGKADRIVSAEVVWPGGRRQDLGTPAVDRWHVIRR